MKHTLVQRVHVYRGDMASSSAEARFLLGVWTANRSKVGPVSSLPTSTLGFGTGDGSFSLHSWTESPVTTEPFP